MSRYENTLTTLQCRTILSAINKYSGKLETREDIEKAGKNIVYDIMDKFPVYFPADMENSFLSFAFSTCAKEAIKRGELTVLDYIAILAEVKEENEQVIKDFGAFGDLYEILVRCALMRKISLVRWSMLSVKDIKTADIISKKFGILEVGHNGKSLTFGTLFDYMEGNYNSVIYGVFSDEDKKDIYNYCKEKKYEQAIEYICSYSVYWSNKYDFQSDMDGLTRGKGIAVKGANIQVVYNSGKYTAFVDAIENGRFTSLTEILNG